MATSGTGGLENDLRNMILSNVSLAAGAPQGTNAHKAPQQQPQRGRGNARGRGRGGSFQHRGRGGTTDAQTGRGQPPRVNATVNTGLARGRGGAAGTPATVPQPRILPRPQGPANADQANGPRQMNNRPRIRGPPGLPVQNQVPEDPFIQIKYLDHLALLEIPKAEISPSELEEKHAFSSELEIVLQEAFAANYSGTDIVEIKLVGFGSLASGFATPGSDMDLAVVPCWKDPSKALSIEIDREIPRILEKAVLDAKMGGRLLTRTRVPILKVCQSPTEALAQALIEERQKWEDLPEEEKYSEAVLYSQPSVQAQPEPVLNSTDFPSLADSKDQAKKPQPQKPSTVKPVEKTESPQAVSTPLEQDNKDKEAKDIVTSGISKDQQPRRDKPFLREKVLGPLDFPKDGVGIQCDINFENPLGIHNTRLLRCYSLCDPRVRPIVLFVKAWAKRRKINSSYSGTLSSYGWVLMVLHYLVNVAQPPVCPNLQLMWQPPANPDLLAETSIAGYTVRFFDNEPEIIRLGQSRRLSNNNQSVGALLRGFFHYYASVNQPYGYGPRPPTFYWTNEVLSLRTPRGIRTKAEKGWTGAKTTTTSKGKEVRHRYLFCIEDPFELDHNVARTVTHFGIVAIRDEFRRAWRILSAIGKGQHPEGGIFDEVVESTLPPTAEKPVVENDAGAKVADDKSVEKVGEPVIAAV